MNLQDMKNEKIWDLRRQSSRSHEEDTSGVKVGLNSGVCVLFPV